MKRIFTFLVLTLSLASAAMAGDRHISFGQLPDAAKSFINTNFSEETVALATKDFGFSGTSYDVRFVSGLKIEFNGKGEWTEMESGRSVLSEKFIPEQIKKYVSGRWSGAKYRKIDKKKAGGFEVKLTNGLEIEFDRNFNVVDIDD